MSQIAQEVKETFEDIITKLAKIETELQSFQKEEGGELEIQAEMLLLDASTKGYDVHDPRITALNNIAIIRERAESKNPTYPLARLRKMVIDLQAGNEDAEQIEQNYLFHFHNISMAQVPAGADEKKQPRKFFGNFGCLIS